MSLRPIKRTPLRRSVIYRQPLEKEKHKACSEGIKKLSEIIYRYLESRLLEYVLQHALYKHRGIMLDVPMLALAIYRRKVPKMYLKSALKELDKFIKTILRCRRLY